MTSLGVAANHDRDRNHHYRDYAKATPAFKKAAEEPGWNANLETSKVLLARCNCECWIDEITRNVNIDLHSYGCVDG